MVPWRAPFAKSRRFSPFAAGLVAGIGIACRRRRRRRLLTRNPMARHATPRPESRLVLPRRFVAPYKVRALRFSSSRFWLGPVLPSAGSCGGGHGAHEERLGPRPLQVHKAQAVEPPERIGGEGGGAPPAKP
jgi:hypothetical protein